MKNKWVYIAMELGLAILNFGLGFAHLGSVPMWTTILSFAVGGLCSGFALGMILGGE